MSNIFGKIDIGHFMKDYCNHLICCTHVMIVKSGGKAARVNGQNQKSNFIK